LAAPARSYYRFTFSHGKAAPSLLAGSAAMVAVGLVCARLLRHRNETHQSV
jgi:hypothetical protein